MSRLGLPLLWALLLVACSAARALAGDPAPEQQPADPTFGTLLMSCCCSGTILLGAGAAGFAVFNRVSKPLVEAGIGPSRGPRLE
jgi:hypothetical protein